MSNAVEAALNRSSAEQRQKAQQVIEEARRNIRLVSTQHLEDISPAGADTISYNSRAIEEAKRSIPFETMKDVDEIGAPLPTPSNRGYYNSTAVEVHPNIQSTIENVEQGDGNNYLRENAVDRAMDRQPRDPYQQEQALVR